MRIVMVTSLHDPFDARIFGREAVGLAAAGHDVTVVAPHTGDEVRHGVTLAAVPPGRTRRERMTRTAAAAWRRAFALDADVYHFHDAELIPGALWARARGRRVVYDMHEDFPRTFAAKPWLPAWLRGPLAWLAERLENAACRRFTALVAATPAIAERARRLNARVVTVRNFPRPEDFPEPVARAWHERDHAIAYVGGLADNRGLMEMLAAVARLPASTAPVLRLAGPFETEELRARAMRHPGWARVEYLGWLGRDEVAAMLSRVRVGLVLLRPEPRYQVAWPVKLFEYMAAGVPAVAADFPLWRRIVEDAGCGRVVDPLDPGAIAEAVAALLADPGTAEAMGRRGRAAILERYSWHNEETLLLALYSRLDGSQS